MRKWNEVFAMYSDVNTLVGDVVNVTPSSTVVGDLALYLLNRKMKVADVLVRGDEIDFPQSTKDLFAGRLGTPHHGLPERLQRIVLKTEVPLSGRPGASLPPADFAGEVNRLRNILQSREPTQEEITSSFLYPKVFKNFHEFREQYGNVSLLPTQVFWFGMLPAEEFIVPVPSYDVAKDILGDCVSAWRESQANTSPLFPTKILVKLLRVSPPRERKRKFYFQVEGFERCITLEDEEMSTAKKTIMADLSNKDHVPSPLPGKIESLQYSEGDFVKKGDVIAIVVAMKMEVKVVAPYNLVIQSLAIGEGDLVEEGSLLAVCSESKNGKRG